MDTLLHEPNPRVALGDNGGPPLVEPKPEPTPYEIAKKRIDDLYDEALLWLDGAGITSQAMADDLANLKKLIDVAHKEADEARKAENKPFDDGKAEVQARYAPLISDTKSIKGKTVLAIDACNKALEPWLKKVADDLAAEKKRLRDEAEEKSRLAQEALRASAPENLEGRAAAETLLQEAAAADRVANKAERQTAKAGGAYGRSASLRTYYVATLIPAAADGSTPDGAALALAHFCRARAADVRDFIQRLADEHVRVGDHTENEIPGFKITKDQRL